MRYTHPFTTSTEPLAYSKDLVGTSNSATSDWGVRATLWVEDGVAKQEFHILDNWLATRSWKILFSSPDWCEIQKWIKEHESEIIEQVNANSIKFIQKYFPERLNDFVPETPIMRETLFPKSSNWKE